MNKITKIYVVVLIWGAALLQLFFNSSIDREEKMVEQVMSQGVSNLKESRVKAYSYYGGESLSTEAKSAMVKALAREIGVVSGYSISEKDEGNNSTLMLEKSGKYGDTEIKIITLNSVDKNGQSIEENYIMMELLLKGEAGKQASAYKDQVEEIYMSLGMEPNTNIYMSNQRPGRMSQVEQEQEIEEFLKDMDATEIERAEFDGVLTVYGYSNNIEQYVFQGEEKVNVNMAITYDEEQMVTYIHRAVPFIDRSF